MALQLFGGEVERYADVQATCNEMTASSLIVSGYNEHRSPIIHHNGTVGTLAGGDPIAENATLLQLRIQTATSVA